MNLNVITLLTKPFTSLSFKLTFDVNITLVPYFNSNLVAKLPVSLIFLHLHLLILIGFVKV